MRRLLLPALLALFLPVANAQQAKAGQKPPAPFRWVAPMENAEWARKILPEGVRHATFRSPSMGIEVGYYLYLPPGYDSGTQRYPVVYHLHGGAPGRGKQERAPGGLRRQGHSRRADRADDLRLPQRRAGELV